MRQQKFEEAAEIFDAYIEENPKEPVGYVNFGNLLMHTKEYDQAVVFYEKAIELDEKTGTAHYGIGNVLFEQEKYPEAQIHYQNALKHKLDLSDVHFMLGLSLQYQELHKLALPYLLRAVELDADEEKQFQYGLALANEQLLEEAKEMFEKVLERNKRHSDAHYNLGVIALYNQEMENSMYHFDEALAYQPDHLLAANGKKQLQSFLDEEE